jgi:hypothetical protein
VNPYETDTYCLTDGITNDDDKPITHRYNYSIAPPLILTCLTDIDLGGQLPTTSGYLLYLNGQLFHWQGRTERFIITATATGEYNTLSRGNQASKKVNAVITFFGNHSPHYHLYTDSQAAEHTATQPTMSEHSRSIDLRHHSIRQDYLDDLMRIGGVSSKDSTSDILTKSLQPDLHTRHTTSLFPDRQGNIPAQQESSTEQQGCSYELHRQTEHTSTSQPITPPSATTMDYGSTTSHNTIDRLLPQQNLKLPIKHCTNTHTSQNGGENNFTNQEETPKNQNAHTNKKRQMTPNSPTRLSPQTHTRSLSNGTNRAPQS